MSPIRKSKKRMSGDPWARVPAPGSRQRAAVEIPSPELLTFAPWRVQPVVGRLVSQAGKRVQLRRMTMSQRQLPSAILTVLLLSVTGLVAAHQETAEAATDARGEAYFRQLLLQDPASPAGYVGLAGALADAGRPQEGVSLLSRAGDRWLRNGEYEKAEVVLATAVEIQPSSAALLALLGQAQTLNRNHRSAVETLARAIDLGHTDPESIAYFASALWETGAPQQAEARYRQSLEARRSFLGLYQLGRLMLWQGRYREAVPLLREAVGLKVSTEILFDLAEAQRGAGDTEAAIGTYRRVLARAPELGKAHYGLAAVLRQIGDLEGAGQELETFRVLVEATEERARIQGLQKGEVARARELLRSGLVDEAIRHLETLSETGESLRVLAQALMRRDDAQGAVRALERAVRLDPGDNELRRQLSEARRAASAGGGS